MSLQAVNLRKHPMYNKMSLHTPNWGIGYHRAVLLLAPQLVRRKLAQEWLSKLIAECYRKESTLLVYQSNSVLWEIDV